ncbi:hypothetical protein K505DRAFT_327178 [Melanomma pulvis-pyrius CBS 109.77]|uniref:Protein kinase domain-containing protein n=1 Tax=Melanomma pulvis-pyrius CBS 109.77 TaxID=1314802 RepID=A0A6A6X3G5_9PLEO|nr:hypothetical protein K505DRAFT_327178 [Melanomma pulvis-pyrius CBS 109.77]
MYLAKPLDNPPTNLTTLSEYRAPEDLLSTQGSPCLLNQKVDIWSFGLIMCNLFADNESPLYLIDWMEDEETVEDYLDRHLLQMVDISGEFPPDMDKKWGRRGRYFLQEGQESDEWSEYATRVKSGGLEKEFEISRGTKIEYLIKEAADRKEDNGQGLTAVAGASEEDKEAIIRIISRCLALDSDSRPEAEDLLQDAFFQEV